MPYAQRPFRPAVAGAFAIGAALIPQLVRPTAGSDGALLLSLLPVVAAAGLAGWREALVSVWVSFASVQAAGEPSAPPFPGPAWAAALAWGAVYAVIGTAGCLVLRRQAASDMSDARAALRDRFRLLVESNVVPMFLGTTDGRVTFGNANWGRAVGGHPAAARWDGRAAPGPDARPGTADLPITSYLTVAFHPPGRPAATGHLFLVRLNRDEVAGVFFDQTEARRTEVDLRHSETAARREVADLTEADARKDEALAILAHELRNPLAPIRTAAEVIRRAVAQADRDRMTRIIEAQVEMLVRLVDDLLDVTRIRRGQVQIHKVTLDLVELVNQAAETVRPVMEKERHDFFVGLPHDGPVYVEADRDRIAQVLNNLLTNAAKYTPAGGRIDLALDRVPGGAVVTVTDTGVGIPADFLPRVWDMFVQRRTGLDRAGGGIGIGLTLVKKLVELHGGTAEAESAGEGQGSVFRVTLPRPVLSWRNLPRPASAPPPSKHPRRVLLVEDNMAAAETLAAQLRIEGHTVTLVHDGPAAVALAAAQTPDVVLLDIGLPGMDGYETARRLRAAGCAAVVIAVTGCATDENRSSGLDAGIDHYLLKPVAFDRLRALFDRPRPPAGTGVGYEKLPSVSGDTREIAALAGPVPPAVTP